MRIKSVRYSQLFSFGQFQNETIGLEAELDAGDTVEKVMRVLKVQVINIHDRFQRIRDIHLEVRQLHSQISVDQYRLDDVADKESMTSEEKENLDSTHDRIHETEERIKELITELNKIKEV